MLAQEEQTMINEQTDSSDSMVETQSHQKKTLSTEKSELDIKGKVNWSCILPSHLTS